MNLRTLYIAGMLFVAVAGALAIAGPDKRASETLRHGEEAKPFSGSAADWFRAIRPYCNSVEVETRHRWSPPPVGDRGLAFSAACYALAGKIDRARALILELPADEQWRAAGVVFNVAHPVADAGDDLSAGPIMELVVEFWPNHYMALYHAGISNYELGHHDAARRYLKEFLDYYDQNDGWRSNAMSVLRELGE
jgi:hypothetical protein